MRPFQFILIAMGLCLLAPLFYVGGQKVLLWSRSETAMATVVENVTASIPTRPHRAPTLAPVVRFTTAWGEVIVATSPNSTTPATYKVGDQVKLRYDPSQPYQVELPDFASQWFVVLVTGLFALLGGWLIRAGLRRDPPKHKKSRLR